MADPAATPVDTDNQLIWTEAALRRANRDQIDAASLLLQEAVDATCNWFKKIIKACK